jgi:putative ABC transport system permease protein
VLGNTNALRHITVGDHHDVSMILRDDADRQQLLAAVRAMPGVAQAGYIAPVSSITDGVQTITYVIDDFSVYRDSSIYDGREPRYDNETAIGGKLAEKLGVRCGDEVSVMVGDQPRSFIVTGLFNTIQHGGMRINLTSDGFRRLVPDYTPAVLAVFLNGEDKGDSARFIASLDGSVRSQLSRVDDERSVTDGAIASYVSLCQGLGLGIRIMAGLVIPLALWLLVKTMIVSNRHGYGVRKAVGFTTGDLIRQTLVAELPTVALGLAVGTIAGALLTEPLLTVLLSPVGVMSLDVPLDVARLVGVAAGLLALSVVMVVLTALPLRALSAVRLARENG